MSFGKLFACLSIPLLGQAVRAGPSLTKQMGADLSNLLMKFQEAPGLHADALIQQLQGLADNKDMRELATAVGEQVKEMLTGLQTSHSNDKEELKQVFDEFQTINGKLNADVTAAAELEKAVDSKRGEHFKCRTEKEVPLEKERKIAENNFQLAKATADTKETLEDIQYKKLKDSDHTHVHHGNRDEIHKHATQLSDAIAAYRVALKHLQEAQTERDAKTEAHGKQRDICNDMQQALELAACTLDTEWKVECARYRGQHDNNENSYNQLVANVKVRVADRKQQFTSLNKVECAVDLLAEHANDEGATSGASSDFSKCFDKTAETDHLHMEYNPTPGKLACPSKPEPPCKEAYIKQEYSSLPDDAKETTCVSCGDGDFEGPLPGPVD